MGSIELELELELEIERLITSMVMSDKLRKIENLKIKRNDPKTRSDNFK